MQRMPDNPESTPSPEQEFPIPGNGADPENTVIPEDSEQSTPIDPTETRDPEESGIPAELEAEVDEDGQ